MALGDGAQRETYSGEDLHRNELFGLGNKARDERKIRDADEARELLLLVNAVQVDITLS